LVSMDLPLFMIVLELVISLPLSFFWNEVRILS